MRRLGVLTASLLVALGFAASAGATMQPPYQGLRTTFKLTPIVLSHGDRTRATCRAHGKQLRGDAARIDRKVAPVACEQPPRSKVRDAGFMIVLAP
jgi:hypothetical protein